MKNVIGLLLILLPFIALASVIIYDLGWEALIVIFGGLIAACGSIALGVLLITED